MHYLNNTPGRTCIIDGKKYVFFSGYSYLGMNYVKEFTRKVEKGMKRYGVLYPSSRISNTRTHLYEEMESRLSEITGMNETVTFSSGYLAGRTITAILSDHKNIYTAPGTHPAIASKKNNSISFSDWKKQVVNEVNASPDKEFVLLSDSVNIMEAVVNDFSFVQHFDPSKKIIFLIDDSHGIGVIGKNGEGISGSLPRSGNVDFILCYSLSKAYNLQGGAISCSAEWADKIRHHPNFAASTAMNPSLAYAFLHSAKYYKRQRLRLMENIDLFRDHLPDFVRDHSFDLPMFICRDENAEEIFYRNKMIISSFAYPDPYSDKINRVILNALHTSRDIKKIGRIWNVKNSGNLFADWH